MDFRVALALAYMEPILVSFILAIGLFVSCYLAGLLPLVWTLSESRVQLVTLLGAGLLTGAALGIIIPEGIHSLYSASAGGHDHADVKSNDLAVAPSNSADVHSHGHETNEANVDNHTIVGSILVIGFVCMLLIDQLSARRNKDDASGHKVTATIGLVVHAAADGLALGAAIASAKEDITFIVFLAILLHKAPAAFGLVSFLMHDNLMDRQRIRRHLFFFSLSTPISTLVTTFCLSLNWSSSSTSAASSGYATGLALLFSAGTFLYVATVHVLPEVTVSTQSTSANVLPTSAPLSTNGSSNASMILHHEHGHQRAFTPAQLLCLIGGMAAPLFLGLLHSH